MGVSRAKELGAKVLAMPTSGNAGAGWAAYCTPAGIEAVIAMPADAPPIPRGECAIAGASLYLVKGLISDAGKIVAQAVVDMVGLTLPHSRNPIVSREKKPWGSNWPNSLTGRCPT